jgi:hypothetical protein
VCAGGRVPHILVTVDHLVMHAFGWGILMSSVRLGMWEEAVVNMNDLAARGVRRRSQARLDLLGELKPDLELICESDSIWGEMSWGGRGLFCKNVASLLDVWVCFRWILLWFS